MWLDRFLADCRINGVKSSTIELYADILKPVDLNLEKCKPEEVFEYFNRMRAGHKAGYFRLQVAIIRKCLRFLGREELANNIKLPRVPEGDRPVIETLSSEEAKKIIEGAGSLRDRLIVELLYELGARRGEIANLRIKSVQFDEYSAIVTLTGKTGTRRRRAYFSKPDLLEAINNHPQHGDPDAHLFLNDKGKPLNPGGIYYIVRNLSQRVLGKSVKTHIWRHTRATEDSRLFTDREMMKLFGWRRPAQVGVYSHLSMREVDDKDLVLHGFKTKEEVLRPVMSVRRCENCKADNAPIAVYCVKCGETLEKGKYAAEFQKTKGEMQKRDVMIRDLAEKFEQATKRLENLERKLKER